MENNIKYTELEQNCINFNKSFLEHEKIHSKHFKNEK